MSLTTSADIAGRRFGRLMALEFAPDATKQARFLCQCDCGGKKIVPVQQLVIGKTISCGCAQENRGRFMRPLSMDELLANATPVPISGCWIWTHGCGGRGYGRLINDGRLLYAHRIMLALKLGRELLPTEEARHECDVPACIAPDHLLVGSHQDNMDDMCSRGRHRTRQGEDARSAKLTAAQTLEIRAKYAAGGSTYKELGNVYGVSDRAIGAVVTRASWAHVRPGVASVIGDKE